MPSLSEEPKQEQQKLQSQARQLIATRVMKRLRDMDIMRNTTYPILRNRTPLQAMDDSIRRVAQYKVKPSYKQYWQQNLAGSVITDKLFQFLAKLAARAMEVQVHPGEFEGVSYTSGLKARICQSLLRAAGRRNMDDFQLVMEMLEAMGKGIVVGLEGWRHYKKKVKDTLDENPETGEQKYKETDYTEWNDVWGDIWPAEQVLFGDVKVSHVQKMADIGLERIVKFDLWREEYKGYPDAGLVLPRGGMLPAQSAMLPAFVGTDEVYEVRYYNQATDEFLLMANGIWINPLGNAAIRPNPYRHHKLPVWTARFRPIVQNFIYGMSHPDTMIASSDVYDKVLEAILDRLIIALNAPIIADDKTKGLNNGYLSPNKVIRITRGQVEPKRIDLDGLSGESIKILQVLQARLESNAQAAEITGTVKKTATQIEEEVQAALETVALFLRFMEFAIRDKAELRMANILQFYSMPTHKKDKEVRFKKVVLRDEVLPNGEIGTQEIVFTNRPDQMRVETKDAITPGNTEFIEASPAFIRDFQTELELVPNSSMKKTDTILQQLELNKQRVLAALHPRKFQENEEQFYKDILKVYHNDPSKYSAKKPQPEMMPQEGEFGQEPKMMSMPKEPSLREMVNG